MDNAGVIPVNPLVSAAFAALLNAGPEVRSNNSFHGWCADDENAPLYGQFGKRAGELRVRVDGREAAELGVSPWALLEGVSPLTIDVLLAILVQLCDPRTRDSTKHPMNAAAEVSASRILQYKKFRRWGPERRDFTERVRLEVRRLQAMRFDLIGFPAWDPEIGRWNNAGISVRGIGLFAAVQAPGSAGSAIDDLRDSAWLVRFGQWTQWWLNTQAKVWLGPLPMTVIEFDHRRNRGPEVLAKKIAVTALLLWSAIRSRASIERRVESLLEDIGELPPRAARTTHWAGRLRDRFDAALMLLHDKGLVEDIAWPDRFTPGSRDRNKGWVEPWLASKVVLVRPSSVFGLAEGPKARPPRWRRTAVKAAKPSKKDLRQIRLQHGVSQAVLADALGVSASYLSQVETGRIACSERISKTASEYFAKLSRE